MLNQLICVLLKQFELPHDVVVVESVRPKLARCIARFVELVAHRACFAATCHAPQRAFMRLMKYWAMSHAHLAHTEMRLMKYSAMSLQLILPLCFAEARAWQSLAFGDESHWRITWRHSFHYGMLMSELLAT